ncbi:peptide/nickel transport system substrate-binding protein [Rathayibacter oskolensis]|uniref:Peptide/nickel transport system substrate-binding protein n=1 Tax=Rathayibacter oskolensis TaxID=1891671 RepID=A0A1X7PHT3_9MICO|nr:ABC transporter substrate-binding protein [Rathayibacter oskolensis]SMH50422.1 peptide/nickel transport system substrate-binding protein [Rathayibacter oskolensis]
MFRQSSLPAGRRRPVMLAAALAAAAALVLAGCSADSDASSSDSDEPDVLRIATVAPPVSLDPYLQNVDPVNIWFIALAYDPLIRVDSNGEYVPDLATEWQYLDDANTQFELTIREGVQFSDGSDLTAQGVADSLNYALTSGVNGANWLGSVSSITASSDSTVLITTATSNPSLPELLTQRVLLGSVISPEGLEDKEGLKSNTAGAGPYVLDNAETIADDTYVYTPNEYYWDQDKILWDRVELKVVANTAAALQAVQNGEVDLFRGDTATGETATSSGLEAFGVPLGLLGMNYIDRTGEIAPELADVRVRQALNYAIDKVSIAQAVYGDYGKAGGALALEDTIGFDQEANDYYDYDPEKAKELLAEAGYADGFTVDVGYVTSVSSDILVQAVAANWAEIGVTANLVNYSDAGQAVTDITAKKFPIAYYGYGELPPYIVASSFLAGGLNQYNPWQVSDSQLTETLNAAAAAADADEAQDLYAEAFSRSYVDLAWYGGVVNSEQVFIYDPETVTGLEATTNGPTPDIAWAVSPVE